MDWRPVLSAPRAKKMLVELMGVGSEAKVPVGALELRLELLPSLTSQDGDGGEGGCEARLQEEVVLAQMASEKSKSTEKERLFLSYAKQWWREFLALRPEHSERIVKVHGRNGQIFSHNCEILKWMKNNHLYNME